MSLRKTLLSIEDSNPTESKTLYSLFNSPSDALIQAAANPDNLSVTTFFEQDKEDQFREKIVDIFEAEEKPHYGGLALKVLESVLENDAGEAPDDDGTWMQIKHELDPRMITFALIMANQKDFIRVWQSNGGDEMVIGYDDLCQIKHLSSVGEFPILGMYLTQYAKSEGIDKLVTLLSVQGDKMESGFTKPPETEAVIQLFLEKLKILTSPTIEQVYDLIAKTFNMKPIESPIHSAAQIMQCITEPKYLIPDLARIVVGYIKTSDTDYSHSFFYPLEVADQKASSDATKKQSIVYI